MNRYKTHLAEHFRSCLLLARAHDPHRNRPIELRAIPGMFDVIGISDGVDAWVAPANASVCSINIQRLLQDLQEGKRPVAADALPTTPRPRKRVTQPELIEEPTQQAPRTAPRVRVRLQETPRRVHVRA